MTDMIQSIRPEWSLVMDRLLKVDVTITRWRAKARADFDEFGLDKAAFSAYTAGARSLLPDKIQKELDLLERLARDLLASRSFKTFFGHLMPQEAYEEYKAWIEDKPLAELRRHVHRTERGIIPQWETKSLAARWNELCELIASNRDAIVDEVIETYRPSAIVRWKIENGLDKNADVEIPDEWLDETLADMVRRIPTADEIRASFTLLIVPSFVEAPEEAIKAVKLEEIERQQAEVEARLAEISHAHVWAEKRTAEAQVKAAQDVARIERNTAIEAQELELRAQKEALARQKRITEEVIAHEKRLKEERITKTLDEVAGQLHQLVYSVTTDALEALNKNDTGKFEGRLHPKTIARIKSIAEQVQHLNFTDNAELARVCRELERLTEDGQNTSTNEYTVRTALKNVAISMKADLVASGISSRSARNLGVPDAPGIELVRKARHLDATPLETAIEQIETDQLDRQARALAPVA
jgi:hypothetical protein